MNIERDIEDFNKDIKKATKEIENLKKRIEEIKGEKKDLKSLFLRERTDINEKLNSVSGDILKYLSGDESFAELEKSLHKLHDIAFTGIVGGRVKTDIPLPKGMQRYNYSPEIWINPRGLAFKWKESDSRWEPEYYKRTKCFSDWNEIKILIRDNPKLVDFIKHEDKKKIFNAFYKCLKDWKELSAIKKEWEHNVIIPNFEHGYEIGISECNISETTKIKAYLTYRGIKLDFKDRNDSYYSRVSVDLASEELTETELFILSQLNEDIIEGIKDIVKEVKKIYDKNYKLYKELNDEIAPYIFQKMI